MTNVGGALAAAIAAALTGAALIADRLGAPAELIAGLVLVLAAGGLVLAGLLHATMRLPRFYASAREAGPRRSSFAIAALVLALAGATATRDGMVNPALVTALAFGIVLHGIAAAPALAGQPGLTFPDQVQSRFGSRMLAVLAAMATAGVALALVSLTAPAAIRSAAAATGLAPSAMAIAVPILAGVIAIAGGAGAILAAAGVAVVVLAAGWLPALVPALADAQGRTADLAALAAGPYGSVEISPRLAGIAIAFAGLIAMAGPALVPTGRRAANRAGLIALVLVLAATLLGALVATTAGRRTEALSGQPATTLPPVAFSEAMRGQLTICGIDPVTPQDLDRLCTRAGFAGPLPAQAFDIARPDSGRWYAALLRLPAAIGAAFGLALPAILIVALALGAHLAASALNRDVLRRLLVRGGTASGELAAHRVIVMVILAFASALPVLVDARLLRFALFIAAAVPVPLAMLAGWSRADWRAALAAVASAFVAGIASFAGYLDDETLFLAASLSGLITGVIAAMLFPAQKSVPPAPLPLVPVLESPPA